jgi:hypothetical protein
MWEHWREADNLTCTQQGIGVMDNAGSEAYHLAFMEEGFDPSTCCKGNSQWRRGLALYPRMDIAG